jgi:hypothetical protein
MAKGNRSSLFKINPLLMGLLLLIMIMARDTDRSLASGVLYASPAAAGAADCSSWANACSLQAALSKAASGDEIWVKAGVHTPGATPGDTFSLAEGLALYGGFVGTETDRSQRNWTLNITVLSGDVDNNDIKDANGVVITAANIVGSNSQHVLTGADLTEATSLDGFTITAGNSSGSGGGMYLSNSHPQLVNIHFSGNQSSSNGGGMFNQGSSPFLLNVTFLGNNASGGGGIYNYGNSSPKLTNVRFLGNTASAGAGIVNDTASNPLLINVVFSGNAASSSGGGVYNYASQPALTNVTFSGNSAANGAGLYNYDSSPTLTNCILWGDNGGEITNQVNSSPTITFSVIQSGYAGTGNTSTDPIFMDPDGQDNTAGTMDDDLRLGLGSPAADAGINSALPADVLTDLEGAPRFFDIASLPDTGLGTPPLVDMGAYEAQRNGLFMPLVFGKMP